MIPASADATLRLFVALWPDEATRARLQALADAWRWPPPAFAPLAWPVTAYALVQSTGEPARRYRILQRYAPPSPPAVTIAPPATA